MPILGTEEQFQPSSLQEFQTSWGFGFEKSFEQAYDESITTKGAAKLHEITTDLTSTSKVLTPSEIEAKAKEQGVKLDEIPTEGMKEDVLTLRLDRKKRIQNRQAAIDDSKIGAFGKFGADLAASLLDPLQLGINFIPFAGEARWAAKLETAATVGERAFIRAQMGALNGALGTAALEPVNYGVSKSLGDDYSMSMALANIAIGGVLGAGLHSGFGAIGDAFAKEKSWLKVKPEGKVAEDLAKFTPEDRVAALKAASGMAAEDRLIDADTIFKRAKADKETRLEIARERDPIAFSEHDRLSLELEQRNKRISEIDASFEEPLPEKAQKYKEALDVREKMKDPAISPEEAADLQAKEKQLLGSKDPEKQLAKYKKEYDAWAEKSNLLLEEQAGIRAELEGLKTQRGTYSKAIAEAHRKASEFVKNNPDYFEQLMKEKLGPEYEIKPSKPDSAFIQPDEPKPPQIEVDRLEKIKTTPDQIEKIHPVLQEMQAQDLKNLEDLVKAEGLGEDHLLAMREQLSMIDSEVNDFKTALESMAACQFRGGPRGNK